MKQISHLYQARRSRTCHTNRAGGKNVYHDLYDVEGMKETFIFPMP
jgi:hypothetical protein